MSTWPGCAATDDPVAVTADAAAAEVQTGALGLARLDVAEYSVELRLVDDRAHPGLRIERVARCDALRDLDDLLEQLVLDGRVDE